MRHNIFNTTRDVIVYALSFVRGRTLDLGAGTAKYKDLLISKANEYVTYDLVPGGQIDLIGDISHTGLAGDSFDTIICTQVFEHIPKPWEATREIHRLLKSGGICIVTAPFLQPYHADPYDFYRYTVEGMKALFSDGFKIVEAGPYTRLFLMFSEMFHHATHLSPYKKNWPGKSSIVTLMSSIAKFFDSFRGIGRVYGNVFIIARKI